MSKVYSAIKEITAELAKTGISKDRTANTGGSGTYKFRGIDDVYGALAPLLAKHGLCVLPRFLTRSVMERTTSKGGIMLHATVEAEFDFVAVEDGSKHVVRTFGEAMDSGDKATNKAMSAAFKYAAFQAFCIPTEGDNDSENQTPELVAKSIDRPKAKASAPRQADDSMPSKTAEEEVDDLMSKAEALATERGRGTFAEDILVEFSDYEGKALRNRADCLNYLKRKPEGKWVSMTARKIDDEIHKIAGAGVEPAF